MTCKCHQICEWYSEFSLRLLASWLDFVMKSKHIILRILQYYSNSMYIMPYVWHVKLQTVIFFLRNKMELSFTFFEIMGWTSDSLHQQSCIDVWWRFIVVAFIHVCFIRYLSYFIDIYHVRLALKTQEWLVDLVVCSCLCVWF